MRRHGTVVWGPNFYKMRWILKFSFKHGLMNKFFSFCFKCPTQLLAGESSLFEYALAILWLKKENLSQPDFIVPQSRIWSIDHDDKLNVGVGDVAEHLQDWIFNISSALLNKIY